MDTRKLTDVLRATIDPNQRQQAEEQLSQIHKIIGFAPSLLQVVMLSDVDMPVRQAGVIYLKNLVTQHWGDREVEPGQPLPFSIHEQDRAMIRDAIVDAVVHAPDLIRVQLAVCVSNIVKHDFPGRWTQIVDKISIYLQNPDAAGWTGALMCLYQLVKNFEYKKPEERGPLNEAMNLLFPMMYQLCVRLLPDQSEQSVLLQKQILKIYFALTQYSLPLDLISREVFSQWMEIVRAVADRPVPEQTNAMDEEDRIDLPWWKCKKWALHILHRMFERYGSPGNVTKEYKEFAEWYLKTFSAGILEVLLKILDHVSHAFSWKFLKPHMFAIVQDVLFPILSYSQADEELWNSDPYEYIRVKFDIFEDFVSPVTAAQTLLHSCCKKRKDMLQKTMHFVMQVLTSPNADPRQKDGALHMVGTLADVLLKKKLYKEQMDDMLCQYVFPEFTSPRGHMRARACWVLHYFSEIKFKQEAILAEAIRLTTNALLTDQDLPVKVEAAIALQMLLNAQEKAQKYVEPQIKQITLELLKIIRQTENDDLTSVMQKIAATFSQVLETDEGTDEKAITAMGLLNTIETLLTVMEGQPEIMAQLQPTVLQVVGHIFSQSVMEFYEEALSLVYDLTSKTISPDMWKVLELMYQLLTGDAGEDPECHAAKLLEVIILQCKGHIDQCIPSFVELVLQRLTREVKTSELRTMCLQVVIAALYYNPQLLFETLEKLQLAVSPTESITSHFIKQWIHDTDCFLGLHDRKLCVLGLCTLLSSSGARPVAVSECASQIIPSLILLFDGLKRAYVAKAQECEEEEEEEEESDIDQAYEKLFVLALWSVRVKIGLSTMPIYSSAQKYFVESISYNYIKQEDDTDDDSDDDYEANEETALESYTTPLDEENCNIDEYIVFKEVLQSYVFNQQTVPTSFNFGGTPLGR
ncbi:Importin-7 [Blattella germanica]|nr:Importin-7 [Blattella germanica]